LIGLLSPLAVRPKEASDGFHTIGDVMPLTASAHVVACATTIVFLLWSTITSFVKKLFYS